MQAKDVMTTEIFLAESTDTMEATLQAMNLWNVDQLFVFEEGRFLGIVKEEQLKFSFRKGKDLDDKIASELEKCICMVPPDANLEDVEHLLEKEKVSQVLVNDENEGLIGTISREEIRQAKYKWDSYLRYEQ